MSIQGLKSLRPDLFPDEENGKCGAVKYCAEFLSIGNHSPKRKRTEGGLSDWRHSQSQWKLEQSKSLGCLSSGWLRMLFYVTGGGLMVSCRKVLLHPPRFWITGTMDGEQVGEV